MTYELGIPSECIFAHINLNYYEEYDCSILSGDQTCENCFDIDNIVFDHRTYMFHNIPFIHTISESSSSSDPTLIFNMIYLSGKWLIVSYGNILNELLFYGNTFENIFIESWGYNGISLLPKTQCHIFAKPLKSIIENRNNFSYIMSYYKQDHVCITINKKLRSLFPYNSDMKIQFSYPSIEYLGETETWEVINNFKKNSMKKNLKRFSIISNINTSMMKPFAILLSGNLRSSIRNNSDTSFEEFLDPKLISYQCNQI
jgi:hypothetical protein